MYFKVVKGEQVEREGKKVNTYTVEIEEPTAPLNGAGLITRSAKRETVANYKFYEVQMKDGAPVMVERSGVYRTDKVLTAEEAQETLRETVPTAFVTTCETSDAGVFGLPVELFMELGVNVERPASQKKGQVVEND